MELQKPNSVYNAPSFNSTIFESFKEECLNEKEKELNKEASQKMKKNTN